MIEKSKHVTAEQIEHMLRCAYCMGAFNEMQKNYDAMQARIIAEKTEPRRRRLL